MAEPDGERGARSHGERGGCPDGELGDQADGARRDAAGTDGARRDAADGLISGRFRLGELLGSGGSASVFTALDVTDGATVALKILHPHLSRSVAAREAFFDEARAAQPLRHPNIVAVLGYGVHGGEHGAPAASGDDPQAWIALEHVAGTSLAELVEQRGRLPIGEALAVADGVLSALDFAHIAGVVHRDVSPANVMLVRDPRGSLRPSGVRLVDFGLADAAGRAAVGTDVLGGESADTDGRPVGVVGNVNYLSPEQARGEAVDERGDLYQLGATLYFALVGCPPFVRSTRRAVLLAHLQAPPPVPSVLRPGLPRAIDRLVVKALLKDPAQRFTDAAQMRTAVRTAATHLADGGALPAGDLARNGHDGHDDRAPGSGSPSAIGAHGTMLLPAPSSFGAPAIADDTTQLLPTARSRRLAASRGAVVASGPSSGRASAPAVSRATAMRSAAPSGAARVTATSSTTAAVPPGRGPLARGALALWCGVGVVALLVVGAWALASGSVPPSSFAAGSEQTAAATPEPSTASTPDPTPTQSPTAVAAALIPVPVLQGSLAEARAALAAAGLAAGAVTVENAAHAADSVLASNPVAGSPLAPGAVVDLTVASGSNAVPTVDGATQDDAVTSIRAAGFDVVVTGRADAASPGTVLQTLPASGTVARLGSTVTIVVATPLPVTPPSPTATPTPTPTPTSTAPAPTPAADPR